ncbi:retrovirus-related Pol polyprotein from transposon TNT 1-94 [Trichonephila clavipes]|nr:retrovirus-related Pol polyprotein from transposon TNT 1-94 [Trichonephila clavipes]
MLKDCRLQKSETKNSDFPYRQAVEDIVKVKRVFRYIAGTVGYGISYHATETKGVLHCYSDSDFGGCTKTSQSTSGYVMIYAGGAISWRSQRQAIVATSTTEAEVIAASEAAKEVIWLCRLIQGIVNLREIPTHTSSGQQGSSKVVTQP